jgi:hypothetical protein
MPFLGSMDIANDAMQLLGAEIILSPTEDSKNNLEASFAYDKLRRLELRRNNWVFAMRRQVIRAVDTNTMTLQPAQYNSATVYQPGSITADLNNQFWISMTEANQNNLPGGNNEVWESYFGPRTIEPYDTTGGTTYATGELVYTPGLYPGSYVIYMSLINNNADVPNVATAWSSTVQYNGNSFVSYGGSQWASNVELNLNITPAVGPLPFDPGATYSTAQTVTASDNFIYSSVGSGNTGNNPVTDGGVHWTNTGLANAWTQVSGGVSSTNWRIINATMKNLSFSYPAGAGPSSQTSTRNVFRLPAGFLNVAPQDPKAGSVSYLGAPSGLKYNDWLFEGNFIVTQESGPLVFRFVADITKVSQMDDLFCHGLACRMAAQTCQTITQSDEKLQTIASEYQKFMGDARVVNSIESGAVEPPEDDYITARI